MEKLYAPSTVNALRARYGFKNTKSLGQNFLTDQRVIDEIIAGAKIGPADLVIEIGPGLGVLTAEAAEQAARVVAIEIDRDLLPILQETLDEYQNIEIINQDVLKTDINRIITSVRAEQQIEHVRIIGNLPYYITTPIIMKLLSDGVQAESITVMMQKEVADRIRSAPGKKTYGAISAAVQYYCEVSQVVSVPRSAFIPQPKVDSAVLQLTMRKEKAVQVADEQVFFSCIKAAFGQRRKTLCNALTGACGMEKDQVREVLVAAGIDGNRRGETLSLEEFAALANEVATGVERNRGTDGEIR